MAWSCTQMNSKGSGAFRTYVSALKNPDRPGILRDYSGDSHKSSEEALKDLLDGLTHYLEKARHPFLDACKAKDVSDLILDGWRSLDDLKTEVLARIDSSRKS